MDFICAGNWKLNKNPLEAKNYCEELLKQTQEQDQAKLIVLPPALCAYAVAEGLKNSKIAWGGQNVFAENSGAFTGENSAATLKDMGAKYCLVGHSERRSLFFESDELVAKKINALQSLGLTPIFCVGETLAERKANQTEQILKNQLERGLKLTIQNKPLIVAYEPVWAIGTGVVASLEQVKDAHLFLRKELSHMGLPANTPILYGGSVKPDNARELSSVEHVNGFLIGGASLKVSDFLAVLRATAR